MSLYNARSSIDAMDFGDLAMRIELFVASLVVGAFSICLNASTRAQSGGVGDQKQDLARFEGTWSLTGGQVRKATFPPEKPMKYIFRGNSITIMEGQTKAAEMTFKIDPSKSPRTIDIVIPRPQKGAGDSKTRLGIYEFKDDTLKICLTFGRDSASKRPDSFNDKDAKLQIMFLKKDKK